MCDTLLYHVDRGFRNPRGRRFVGLGARGSASAAKHSRDATLAAGGAAWASRHRRSLLPCSRAARPATGLDQGTASFGTIATALIALAALVGGGLLAAHLLKRRIAGIMIGIHATLAVGGFVILAAYIFAG
jgi:hypothetical protein